MAHERIVSEDTSGELVVQWNDDGQVVSIGMIWDDPDAREAADDGTGEPGSGEVIERRVEGGPGGMIAVPTRVEPYQLRPYQDADGRWSMYLHFDRPKSNAIVRIVRRARSKAFGPDE